MRGEKIFLILMLFMIFVAVGWSEYTKHKIRQSEGWKDAHPTQEQADRWLLKNFDPERFEVWNKNPQLDGPEFCTGIVTNKTTHLTPFGENDWGMGIYSWGYTDYEKTSATYPVDAGKLQKDRGEEGVYIFVEHRKRGQYGIGNILQGWIHEKPPPFSHRVPQPLKTADKKVVLSFDLKIDKAEIERFKPSAWQFIGSTIWFNSAELKKPLVVDLLIYTNSEVLYSKNAENAYRYQKVAVADKREAFGKWRHYDIDVSWFVSDMLKRFNIEYAAPSLELWSLEILCETMYGECGFYTKNVYLYYK